MWFGPTNWSNFIFSGEEYQQLWVRPPHYNCQGEPRYWLIVYKIMITIRGSWHWSQSSLWPWSSCWCWCWRLNPGVPTSGSTKTIKIYSHGCLQWSHSIEVWVPGNNDDDGDENNDDDDDDDDHNKQAQHSRNWSTLFRMTKTVIGCP